MKETESGGHGGNMEGSSEMGGHGDMKEPDKDSHEGADSHDGDDGHDDKTKAKDTTAKSNAVEFIAYTEEEADEEGGLAAWDPFNAPTDAWIDRMEGIFGSGITLRIDRSVFPFRRSWQGPFLPVFRFQKQFTQHQKRLVRLDHILHHLSRFLIQPLHLFPLSSLHQVHSFLNQPHGFSFTFFSSNSSRTSISFYRLFSFY
ncbi:hypothetical protein FJT64_000339 [Amphibalanus amphitrite]|uniref:Uncharacterized protein n=1 Tax=Amphibalanus amphitrite TaxID=1232801 RepID=A0A6A4WDI6_AMPAM|nr:hypothetical protein FJT64_000339 [Amphibalanus amphitrite]